MLGRPSAKKKECAECKRVRRRSSYSKNGWARTRCCRECAKGRLRATQKLLGSLDGAVKREAGQKWWYARAVKCGAAPKRCPRQVYVVKMTSWTQAAWHHARVPHPRLVSIRFCLERLRLLCGLRNALVVAVAAARASREARGRKLVLHSKKWPRDKVLGCGLVLGQSSTWKYQKASPRRGKGKCTSSARA